MFKKHFASVSLKTWNFCSNKNPGQRPGVLLVYSSIWGRFCDSYYESNAIRTFQQQTLLGLSTVRFKPRLGLLVGKWRVHTTYLGLHYGAGYFLSLALWTHRLYQISKFDTETVTLKTNFYKLILRLDIGNFWQWDWDCSMMHHHLDLHFLPEETHRPLVDERLKENSCFVKTCHRKETLNANVTLCWTIMKLWFCTLVFFSTFASFCKLERKG